MPIKDLIDSFESDEKNKGRRYREFLYHCFMKFEEQIKKIGTRVRPNMILSSCSPLDIPKKSM